MNWANNRANAAQAEAARERQYSHSVAEDRNRVIHKYNDLVYEYDALLDKKNLWEALARDNAHDNRLASQGNTVAGYTNNLAQELNIFKGELLHHFYTNAHPDTKLALPTGYNPKRAEAYGQMSMEHRKYINLRVMCRAEWYDWCLHVDVLAKASQAVVNAMMAPSDENTAIRNRGYLTDLKHESEMYHRMRDEAMDENKGVAIRDRFETERMAFWKDKVRYYIDTEDRNIPIPKTNLTAEANPGIHFDLHLPAGRLTKKWGIDIITGKPANCFRASNAGCLDVGMGAPYNVAGVYL